MHAAWGHDSMYSSAGKSQHFMLKLLTVQVQGLYRGLAAPLVGGALETAVSYGVRV